MSSSTAPHRPVWPRPSRFLELSASLRPSGRDPSRLEGLVIDDRQAAQSGSWKPSRATQPFLGAGYLHDDRAGDGKASATFRVEVPSGGDYRIRLLYPPHANRATNALITIRGDQQAHESRRRRLGSVPTASRSHWR